MPAVEMDNAVVRELLGQQSHALRLFDWFVLPTATNGVLDATLGGSGTLVTIDEVQGFLTPITSSIAQDEQRRRVGSSNSKQELHHVSFDRVIFLIIRFVRGIG